MVVRSPSSTWMETENISIHPPLSSSSPEISLAEGGERREIFVLQSPHVEARSPLRSCKDSGVVAQSCENGSVGGGKGQWGFRPRTACRKKKEETGCWGSRWGNSEVPFYVLAQFTGAISAALTLRELLDPIERIGTTTPSGTDVKALVMEIVVTFNMMFITSAVATDAKAVGELAGLAVGSAVCITSIVAGPVSGGSMNPARTLGPAIASREYKGLWVYFLGPVTGTLLGSWFYKVIQLSERKPIINPSLSLKLRRMMSNNVVQADQDDKLELAVTSV